MKLLQHAVLGVFLLASSRVLVAAPSTSAALADAFAVHFDEAVFTEPFTGDLFIAFGEVETSAEPRELMHGWFGAPPVLRFGVENVKPGETLHLAPSAAQATFPADWSEVQGKPWRVQAIARVSRTGRQAGLSAGDVYGEVLTIDPLGDVELPGLTLDRVVPAKVFPETDRLRLFEFHSPSLSRFFGFDYVLQAGVRLPEGFGEQDSYPVVYSVTGFGSTHESVLGWDRRIQPGSALDRAIVVVPDASNRYGHSVFCDSRSIGPWGEALVRELIPALEEEFDGAGPEHRYVTGVSSGGWSSLWLQVAYPDAFAGCWSHVPDPIDFHDFQQINLYEPNADGSPRNMYVDEAGQARPLARRNGEVMLTYEDFVRREHVLNPGGQIRSFEATFSRPLEDGSPRRVFDVETGVIDHAAAQEWRPYDISHRLLTGWEELRGSLAGKIHVYAGEVDTFYLEGAVERFQALAREAGLLDEMVIEVVPGMAHELHGPGHEDMLKTLLTRWSEAKGS